MRITLPYPPSVNHYWRHIGTKVLVSREGREFRETVGLACRVLRVQQATGDLSIEIEVYPPDRRRRDLDNILKGLLDALQHGGAYEDDSQIVKLTVIKRAVTSGGRVVVLIEELLPHQRDEGGAS